MKQAIGFVFPGQGSQKVGMLAELGLSNSIITETFQQASEVLGYDLWDLVQNDADASLGQTEITQPAILTASVAIWRLWQQKQGQQKQQNGVMPRLLAGHSLGEYSALVCAEALEFQQAVALVKKRGEYMQAAVPAGVGAMAAIVGLDNEAIVSACKAAEENQVVAPANFNSPAQVVIAGNKEAVSRAMTLCKNAGAKRVLPLSVSVPSHCQLMQPAAEKLARDFASIALKTPTIPVVQNITAEASLDPAVIQSNLIRQLSEPVLWVDSIEYFQQQGFTEIVECGPGRVLCGLIKRIQANINSHVINTPESLESTESALQAKESC